MKKLFCLLCLTLISAFAFSQWILQDDSLLQGSEFFSVYFPDANTGYAVGVDNIYNGPS